MGGELLGVPVLVTEGQGAGKVTFVDTSGLAIASEPIVLRSSDQASLQMDDAPTNASDTPTATSLVSMFQTNCRCLLAERHFAVKVAKPNAVASVTNVTWGNVGDSPAGQRTKQGLKDHPALKHELANRSFVVRTLHRLGLDVEAIKPVGRPAGYAFSCPRHEEKSADVIPPPMS
jgi:hypothetical protein